METNSFIINEKYINSESIETSIILLNHYISSINAGRDFRITYGDLCKKLSFHPSPRTIDKQLGDLSFACKENGLPPISAIVVNNDKKICGDGFFKAYCNGIPKDDKKMFIWVDIINRIVQYPNWNAVLEKYIKLA